MAKKIMIMGTMSNAGKSLLCTGLCRILAQDGFKVAPFKSQNMALNSYITEEGLEMGRAQVVQAEAAGIRPQVRMNPILLKPTSDTLSQVIVNGKVRGNMPAREYYGYKKQLIPDILDAFHSLEEDFDVILLEGAGSPVEINLKDVDIVNMGLARMTHSPVLLVGDIDRGGVFAQLLGTLDLLEPEEKALVKGLIINKFRGDASLLTPGITELEERGSVPVLGLVPYMDVELEDEDSLSERFTRKEREGAVDLAVIRFPRISNFTDFLALENMEGVRVRYVEKPSQLENPDMILLPGTKNTMGDLLWMRQNGLEAAILRAAGFGKVIFGICGGYQMLGRTLFDPEGIENAPEKGSEIRGMGLLNMDTVFTGEKERSQVRGKITGAEGILKELNGLSYEGYEIHMGRKAAGDEGKTVLTSKGNVYGTYVHGLFDDPQVSEKMVGALAGQKGLAGTDIRGLDMKSFKESQYNYLADVLREALDMEKIYQIIEEGV